AAERHRADTLPHRLLDVLEVRAPPPRLTCLFGERVVHDGPARRLGDPAEEPVLELGVGAAAALDHAGADLTQHVGQREQLGLRRGRRRDAFAGDVEVVHVARDREPERAGLERLAHHPPHGLELGVGGLTIGALLAHRVEPHRGVADERADVHRQLLPNRAHVLGERFPVPRHARAEHVHRDRFDVGEHPGEPLARFLLYRRERQRAVTDDDGGRAVVAGVGAERIPQHLGVVVAVVVHEARRDDPPVGLDDLACSAAQATELDDLAAGYPDIAVEGGAAGAVDDASVLDQQVVGHAALLSWIELTDAEGSPGAEAYAVWAARSRTVGAGGRRAGAAWPPDRRRRPAMSFHSRSSGTGGTGASVAAAPGRGTGRATPRSRRRTPDRPARRSRSTSRSRGTAPGGGAEDGATRRCERGDPGRERSEIPSSSRRAEVANAMPQWTPRSNDGGARRYTGARAAHPSGNDELTGQFGIENVKVDAVPSAAPPTPPD